jgi:hypothetical protein
VLILRNLILDILVIALLIFSFYYFLSLRGLHAYEGSMADGLSAAYIANYYRARGSSFLAYVHGVSNEGMPMDVVGRVIDSTRSTIVIYSGNRTFSIYSDGQKVKEPFFKDINSFYIQMRSVRELRNVLVKINPISGNLYDLEAICNNINSVVRHSGLEAELITLNFYLFNSDLMNKIRSGDVPIQLILYKINTAGMGRASLVTSVLNPYYLSIQDMPLQRIRDLDGILGPWMGEDAFISEIEVRIVLNKIPTQEQISYIIRAIEAIPGVRFAKIVPEFW